ncbi:hypothetical protein ACFVT5_41430 [Streptomyces sp. NPDC058001]|uniref:hypothetical protein n=1 Tax=Streptomyces sp. NPDC058001 TaxID=3346300 RepID=UPI0036F15FA9
MTREEMRAATEQLLSHYRQIADGRDRMVRDATTVGVTKNRIHTLTGIARTTIDRILEDTMTIALVSAESGDRMPGHELADPDCPEIPGLLDRPDVEAFMEENGYGPDNPDELMYLVTEDDLDSIPDGFPTLTIRLPKAA